MDDETEVVPALEEEEVELETESEEEAQEEEVDWKTKAEKAEELAKNYKIRAEKAEGKKETKEVKPPKSDLSTIDLYAMTQANVPLDDVEEVQRAAKVLGVSIPEALKSNIVKTLLAEKAEIRATAEATAVGTARRSTGKLSGDALLENAKSGKMPESDAELAELFKARMGIK